MIRCSHSVEHTTAAASDCGEPALNNYLGRHARQNQESGIARTFVTVGDEAPNRILGYYYSLTASGIAKVSLPPGTAKRFPDYRIRIARLAVDLGTQGQGLGEHLLMDALHRCLRAAREAGITAVLVDAKHEVVFPTPPFMLMNEKTVAIIWLGCDGPLRPHSDSRAALAHNAVPFIVLDPLSFGVVRFDIRDHAPFPA